jgi:hypothetical protein
MTNVLDLTRLQADDELAEICAVLAAGDTNARDDGVSSFYVALLPLTLSLISQVPLPPGS